MRSLSALILAIFLFSLPAFTQQRWERTYGGARNDYCTSVQQTTDGGYILAGYTSSVGNGNQVYLIKTNAFGDTLWSKTYGGGGTDEGNSVQQTTDGGYIIAGYTGSFGNWDQVYLIKTNASGDTLWTRNHGGPYHDYGYSVQQTSDGGYIIAGHTYSFGNYSQFYLVKTNASGDTLWTRPYGGPSIEEGRAVQQTSDGGYIVVGRTTSFGGAQVYLVKTNNAGDTLWTRAYGITNNEIGYDGQQTTDGGYIVTGMTWEPQNRTQVYLIKTNSTGDTLWTKTYGDTLWDYGLSVLQTTDGGYIVAGVSSCASDSTQISLVKSNATGTTLWARAFGGIRREEGNSVQQTSDGGYIVGGTTTSFGDSTQFYVIKTDSNGYVGVESNTGFEGPRGRGVKITPNPFTSFATLPGHEAERFSLYDVSGRKVGQYKGDRVGENLAPGVYFLRSSGGKDKPLRIVKVR